MQQKGRTEQILERLQEMINNGQGSLAPGKVSLPKEELSRLILELSLTMETELKQYRDVTDKRAKVLKDAKKQAEDIIYEAEQSASRIRVSGRKTDVAPVRMLDLTETERRSLDSANEIYAATLIYTDEMMAEMQDVIADAYEKISTSYEIVLDDLRQKSEIIVANRQELMADLQSMEKEDRYQQIMEIGQLLSEELYYARKGRMGEETVQEAKEEAEKPEASGQQVSTVQATQSMGVVEAMKQAAKAAKSAEVSGDAADKDRVSEEAETVANENKATEAEAAIMQNKPAEETEAPKGQEKPVEEAEAERSSNSASISPVISMDPVMQQDVAATVASMLEEKKRGDVTYVRDRKTERQVEDKKVEVAEITKEVSEAVKKDPQQNISNSVIEAMKRAAKKAVLGLDEEEDDIFMGEFDEDMDDENYRAPTQPLDTEEINKRAEQEAANPKTPEQIKEERHRDFVEAHEEKVRAEEEKWLNAVYNPVIPDANAVDPIVAMVLQEKEAAKNHDV